MKLTPQQYADLLKSNPSLRGPDPAPCIVPGRAGKGADDPVPLERVEQERLADWLDARGLDWFHCPNERASKAAAGRLKRQGVKPGVPDVVILDHTLEGHCGCAIELKRRQGSTVQETQREWLERFRTHGRAARICYGADEAIAWIKRLYG